MRLPLAAFALGSLTLLTLAALPARAQIAVTWTERTDLTLPPGVRLYETTTPVRRGANVDALHAWYVRADTARAPWAIGARLSDASGGLETTQSFAAEPGVGLAINGGYFGGGASVSLVVDGGQTLAQNIGALGRSSGTYYPTRGAFGLLTSGAFDVAWVYGVAGTTYAYPNPSPNTETTPAPQPSAAYPAGGAPWPARTAMGGGPVLVADGAKRVTWAEEVFFGSGIGDATTSLQPRTAVGYTSAGEVLMMVVDGRQPASAGVTLSELADLFLALGAREAMNLDGGGSSTLVVGGTLVNRPEGGTFQRSVASALVIGPKRAGGAGTGETFTFDADVASPTYRETGSWIESSNTPFHGATKARLNAAGNGTDRGVFRLTGFPTGRYEVAAWWVPSSNRATNTPFTIYQNGAATTVRADQTPGTTAGKWNVLGSFTLAATDSVAVSDDALPAGAFVVADGLRLVRLDGTAAERETPGGSAGLRLYPNPARRTVTLERAVGAAADGAVYDVLGRAVVRFTVSAGAARTTVDLPALPPGLYLVEVGAGPGALRRALTVR